VKGSDGTSRPNPRHIRSPRHRMRGISRRRNSGSTGPPLAECVETVRDDRIREWVTRVLSTSTESEMMMSPSTDGRPRRPDLSVWNPRQSPYRCACRGRSFPPGMAAQGSRPQSSPASRCSRHSAACTLHAACCRLQAAGCKASCRRLDGSTPRQGIRSRGRIRGKRSANNRYRNERSSSQRGPPGARGRVQAPSPGRGNDHTQRPSTARAIRFASRKPRVVAKAPVVSKQAWRWHIGSGGLPPLMPMGRIAHCQGQICQGTIARPKCA
jgi:hypothetical protein